MYDLDQKKNHFYMSDSPVLVMQCSFKTGSAICRSGSDKLLMAESGSAIFVKAHTNPKFSTQLIIIHTYAIHMTSSVKQGPYLKSR